MARKYPQEVREFIIENVRGHTSRELADMVNAEFGLDVTPQKIASTKKNWGLVSGTPCGLPAGAGSKVFPREIVDYILANHKGTGHQEMADRLREKFGREYAREQIKGFYHNRHLDSGIKGYFQKSHVPQNKGKTWDDYMTPEAQARARAGQFQKGHTPHNGAVPVGTVRIRHDHKDRNAKPYGTVYRLRRDGKVGARIRSVKYEHSGDYMVYYSKCGHGFDGRFKDGVWKREATKPICPY